MAWRVRPSNIQSIIMPAQSMRIILAFAQCSSTIHTKYIPAYYIRPYTTATNSYAVCCLLMLIINLREIHVSLIISLIGTRVSFLMST